MASISLDEAAARIGVSPQTIEAWAEQGLLTIHQLVARAGPNFMGLLWPLKELP